MFPPQAEDFHASATAGESEGYGGIIASGELALNGDLFPCARFANALLGLLQHMLRPLHVSHQRLPDATSPVQDMPEWLGDGTVNRAIRDAARFLVGDVAPRFRAALSDEPRNDIVADVVQECRWPDFLLKPFKASQACFRIGMMLGDLVPIALCRLNAITSTATKTCSPSARVWRRRRECGISTTSAMVSPSRCATCAVNRNGVSGTG